MYKITKTLSKTYSEIGQVNPLRWEILYRESEDSFTSQSGLIKCKDFFNEIVRKYVTGQDSGVYGFSTHDIKLNTEGMYFRMWYVVDKEKFSTNINNTINVSKDSDTHVTLEDLGDKSMLLFIPRMYFNSTYLTSLVTYIIRCCNTNVVYSNIDELWDKADDVAINNGGRKLAIKWGFNVPEQYQNYWYFINQAHNSEKQPNPEYAAIVHNNGVMSWSTGV